LPIWRPRPESISAPGHQPPNSARVPSTLANGPGLLIS
jgi:hypothetical protein